MSTNNENVTTKFDLMYKAGTLAFERGNGSRSPEAVRLSRSLASLDSTELDKKEAGAIAAMIDRAYEGGITEDELAHVGELVTAANEPLAKPAAATPPAATPPSANAPGSGEWTFKNNGNGTGSIDLGRYKVDLKESNYEWMVTDKQTGQQTRVWGDPHVDFQNDGDTDLDFKANLNLMLADGTKITCETLPFGNGKTVSSRLVITNGDQALEVTGLAKNKDAAMNIRRMDNPAAAWDSSWGKTTVYQGTDGSWYAASGLLQQGAIRNDGTLDLSKVDKSQVLQYGQNNSLGGYNLFPALPKQDDKREDTAGVDFFNENYAYLYNNDEARKESVRNLLRSMQT